MTSYHQRPRFAMIEQSTPIQRLTRLEAALGRTDGPPIYVDATIRSAGAATSSGNWNS